MTEDSGFLFPVEAYDFSLFHKVQIGSEAHASSYTMRTAGIKQQGHEADHSPPSSAEVENGEAIPPLPH
jgi:hypothetical protein